MYVILSPEKVRELHEERGLDRRALAEAAGLSMDTMRRVEDAKGAVTFESARKIARALELGHPIELSATPDPRDSIVMVRRAHR